MPLCHVWVPCLLPLYRAMPGQPPASQQHELLLSETVKVRYVARHCCFYSTPIIVQHGIVSPFAFHQPALPVVPESVQLDSSSYSYQPRSLRAASEPGKVRIAQLIKDRSASLGEMTRVQLLELEGHAHAKGPSKLGSAGGLCQVCPSGCCLACLCLWAMQGAEHALKPYITGRHTG